MIEIFRALSRRLYSLFATHVALDFEREFLLQQTDRKADLLRKAQELEEQGLSELAEELREQTRNLSVERPLSSVMPALEEFRSESANSRTPVKALETDGKSPQKFSQRKRKRAK